MASRRGIERINKRLICWFVQVEQSSVEEHVLGFTTRCIENKVRYAFVSDGAGAID